MKNPSLLRRFLAMKGIHYIVTHFGPSRLRGLAFDGKYQNGEWNFTNDGNSELPKVVRRYLRKGDLLVMGCGGASVLEGLEADGLNSALGLDLSEEAIHLASRYASTKVNFAIGNMETFECSRLFDVILFSESLNYIPLGRQPRLLRKLGDRLKPGGAFVVTLAQAKRYHEMFEGIRANFEVLEDRNFTGSSRHLIVFRLPS